MPIRDATPADVPEILAMIRELADYERAPDAVVATTDLLHEALFCESPAAFALIAGALMPLAVLTACSGPGTAAEPSSTTPTASSEVAVEPTARPVDLTDALNEARNTCSAADDALFDRERGYYTGMEVADDGTSIIIDSWGIDNIHTGAAGEVFPGNGHARLRSPR